LGFTPKKNWQFELFHEFADFQIVNDERNQSLFLRETEALINYKNFFIKIDQDNLPVLNPQSLRQINLQNLWYGGGAFVAMDYLPNYRTI
jgi:hypothetical protein